MQIVIDIPNPPVKQEIIDIPIHFCGGHVVEAGGYGFEERKTGKWKEIITDNFFGGCESHYICSECKDIQYDVDDFKYCPKCGAKMEVDE